MSEKTTGIIIAMIVAGAGLGLSGYMFIKNEIIFPPSSDTGLVLVGYWEDVFKNKSHPIMNLDNAWLLEVGDEQFINDDYIVLNQTTGYKNTRFHLVNAGFYKITINVCLENLLNTQGYGLYVSRDGEGYGMTAYKKVFHVVTPNALEYVGIDFYLESNGTNFYEFQCFTLSAPFDLKTDQKFNHISIEYLYM